MSNLKLIIVRLTRGAFDALEDMACQSQPHASTKAPRGCKTEVLRSILANCPDVALRGDSRARDCGISIRLKPEMIANLDSIAKRRGCSRTTLVNSCIIAEYESRKHPRKKSVARNRAEPVAAVA